MTAHLDRSNETPWPGLVISRRRPSQIANFWENVNDAKALRSMRRTVKRRGNTTVEEETGNSLR